MEVHPAVVDEQQQQPGDPDQLLHHHHRPSKAKTTKGILKNSSERHSDRHDRTGSGGRKQRRHGQGRRVEITLEPGSAAAAAGSTSSSRDSTTDSGKGHHHSKHRHRSGRHHHRETNIYDTPKGNTVKWKEDLNAAYERSRGHRHRRESKTIAAVNPSIITGWTIIQFIGIFDFWLMTFNWKYNFPVAPHVRLVVGWSVGYLS